MSEQAREKHRIAAGLLPLAGLVDDLVLDPANRRLHGERNLTAIKASLDRFGQRKPIVVRRTPSALIVLAGNGTLQAARELGWTHIARVIVEDDDATATAFALADNRTAELADWDIEGVVADVQRLEAEIGGMTDLGFDARSLDALLADLNLPIADPPQEDTDDEDEDEDEQAGEPIPASEPGVIYRLGPHRLLCGDSTKAEDVEKALGGQSPGGMIFDPPFDLDYEQWSVPDSVRLLMVWARGYRGVQWVGARVGAAEPAWGISTLVFSGQARGWARPEWPCCVHEVVYVLRRGEERGAPIRSEPARAYGLRLTRDSRPFSWYDGLMSRRNDMSWAKNPACYAPWLCMARPGEVIYDPCAGSGSSLLACARSGNPWIGIELQPRWCDMIRRRWRDANSTGGS